MQPNMNLWEDFPPTTKAEWLEQLSKDLKGKALADLRWQLDEGLEFDPFYHPDDFAGQAALPNFTARRSDNAWEIGEYIDVSDMATANAQVLEGLNGGVQAPLFRLRHEPGDEELARLLQGIHPQYITLHFEQDYPGKDPEQFLYRLGRWLRQQGMDTDQIGGSVDFDPLLDWVEPPFEMLGRVVGFCIDELPRFKALQIDGRLFHDRPQHVAEELALILAKGSEYFARMGDMGLLPSLLNRHLQIAIAVNTSFFVAIAKIRALKILWSNLLGAYGYADAPLPPIVAHFAPETQTEDPHTNMIRAATQAMSAVIGGANRLYVLPADAATRQESSAFSRRIARNVQHLLQLESYLDRVVDPAAGSYYIETLTDKLAQKAWASFLQMEKAGGFL